MHESFGGGPTNIWVCGSRIRFWLWLGVIADDANRTIG
jgi:hypothetical protein